jgi:enterochelin esterase-like enzyme
MRMAWALCGALLCASTGASWLHTAAAQNTSGESAALAIVETLRSAASDSEALDSVWDGLVLRGEVPFTTGEEAVFLYRGEADSVYIAGDHTGWQPRPESALTRITGTDVWMRFDSFPEDTRIDYKLVVDDEWILDPVNPLVQWSGFGPNSELRMPAWQPAPETFRRHERPQGTLTDWEPLESAALGFALAYRVYSPAGHGDEELPVLYFTDGHEYADDRLGAATIVLDNLIAEGRMERALAVFIDPRVDGANIRADLYLGNPSFASFLAHELVPHIDREFATRQDRTGRVIVGTSFGGFFASYLLATHPDIFGKAVIQSPALWPGLDADWSDGGSIFDLIAALPARSVMVHMTSGTIGDGAELARVLRDVLEQHEQAVTYYEVNEGHSWGNWRARLPGAIETVLPAIAASTSSSDTHD